jgi:hypothetical protein
MQHVDEKSHGSYQRFVCRLLNEPSAWMNGALARRFNAIRFPVDKHE